MALQLVPRLEGSTGHRIQQARNFRLWNQGELLEAMAELDMGKVPVRKTLSDWENDKRSPSVDAVKMIARATGFPVEDFVADDAPTPDPEGPDADRGTPPGTRTQNLRNESASDGVVVPLKRVA